MHRIIKRLATTVNYGFKQVTPTEKEGLVTKLFNDCATKYDQMNDYLSFGSHKYWKDEMVSQIGNLEPDYSTGVAKKLNIIDVAGGTGDISMRILEKAKSTRFYKASKHKHR